MQYLRTSLIILSHNWWILGESTNSSAPSNSIPWRSLQMQLVSVTRFILTLFLVQKRMYKGTVGSKPCNPPPSATHQEHLGKATLPCRSAHCRVLPQNKMDFSKIVNAFKPKNAVSPTPQCSSSKVPLVQLTHENFPDTRKQRLQVKQKLVVRFNTGASHCAASHLRNNSPLFHTSNEERSC